MPAAGFEPAIPAVDRLQTHALDQGRVIRKDSPEGLTFVYTYRNERSVYCVLH